MSRDRKPSKRPERRKLPIPPPGEPGINLDEVNVFHMQIEQYGVAAWTPGRDGIGPCEAVVFYFDVRIGVGPNYRTARMSAQIRSPERVDQIVALLRQYQAEVWPDHIPGSGVDSEPTTN